MAPQVRLLKALVEETTGAAPLTVIFILYPEVFCIKKK